MSTGNATASVETIAALPGQPSHGDKGAKPGSPRNVHWGDMHGYELACVYEFEPSSDDDEVDATYDKKGCCIIS